MKHLMLPLCLVVLLALASPVRASVVAVVTDHVGARIEFTDLGTIQSIRCMSQDVLCGEAYSICSSEGVVGVIGGLGVCLLPGTIEFVSIYLHGTQTVLLKPTGTDGATGAPAYNLDAQSFPIPDGTHVFLVLNNKPKPGCCLGVHEFWDITKGQNKVCSRRKIYNTCTHIVTVCSEKEFAKFCPPSGTFVVHNGTVGASFQSGASLVDLFLDSPGNVGATAIKAGSVSDALMPLEWGACGLTSAFKADQEIGDRWEDLFFDFSPGCVPLKPGQEKFIPSCLEWACSSVPPGTPCLCEDE